MGKYDKLAEKILRGSSDANIAFDDLCGLLRHLGFDERIRGSHHIYRRAGVLDLVNLQRQGKNAKPYQVRQVRTIMIRYLLTGDSHA